MKTYGAWVLILQLSAYVGYLDFGVQTAVSKYIAEHEAERDLLVAGGVPASAWRSCWLRAPWGVLTLLLVWRVPYIFHTMPRSLYHDVSISVLFVGISLSTSLATSVFVAIFLGLQQYRVPM